MREIVRWTLLLLAGPAMAASAKEAPLAGDPDPATGLVSYRGCELVPVPWADGDSFRVRFPSGAERTIRFYGMDCFETSDREPSDRRRLLAQRRHFGIENAGGDRPASVLIAKKLGIQATDRLQAVLRKPFTVETAWTSGLGDPRFTRYYGFITAADGRDVGSLLVREGLARAFGVARARGLEISREEYKQRLKDEELSAASRRLGAWKLTNWASLPEERRVERKEEEEERARGAVLNKRSIDPNTASRDELMRLPGIGEKKAIAIMEEREDEEFRSAEDLKRVFGIGKKTAAELAPYLVFPREKTKGR